MSAGGADVGPKKRAPRSARTKERLAARAAAKHARQLLAARAHPADFIEYAIRDEETGRVIKNAPFHREWQDFLLENRYASIIAPVEHGKTQQVVGHLIWLLGHNHSLRMGLISNTADQAQKVLRSIRSHIEHNPLVREVFPTLRPSPRLEDPWHTTAITVARDTIAKDPSISACGVFGPIVGSRKDIIVFDDILDFENTRTEEQRKKLIEWIDTSVITRATKFARVISIGTPWHPDDLLHVLERRHGWATKRYSAVENPLDDPADWRPIWPEQWTVGRLKERQQGTTENVFLRKYLCLVRSDATSRFKEEWFRGVWGMKGLGKGLTFYPQAPLHQHGIGINKMPMMCFTGVDLGVGDKEEDALSVLFTIGLRMDNRRLVVNIESGHWHAPEIVDRIVSHYDRYNSIVMVESNSAQRFLLQFANERVPVDSFHTGANKWDPEWGVESLAVEFRNRWWVLPSGATGEWEHPEAEAWIRECLHFDPALHTGDRLMASWLAREALRRHMGPRTVHVDTQRR